MHERLLPSDEEVRSLWPGPHSITWRRAGDARTLLAAGYALLLQVAHPVVGAGVAEHSGYRSDPWRRLLHTLDFTSALVYSEPAVAAEVARSVRARHRQIRGAMPHGGRYHALSPDAYAWVWASLFAAMLAAHDRFGAPVLGQERETFWQQWRGLGRLLGVRPGDLPGDVAGYERYFSWVTGEVLQDNDSVRAVLATLRDPAAPPLPRYAQPAWLLGRAPGTHALSLATIGLLGPRLRERFGLRWTFAQALELRALGAAARTATPLLPGRLRLFGPTYLGWRGAENAWRDAKAA
jgi:uncharacterized protein (DUF2236 family)